MKQTRNLLFMGALTLLLWACGKDNPEPGPNPTPSVPKTLGAFLIDTRWQIVSMTADTARTMNGTSSRNWFSLIRACRKDNIYRFYGTDEVLSIAIAEGNQQCDSKEAVTVEQAFLFTVNEELKLLSGTSTAENGATQKVFDSDGEDEIGISQEWRFTELTEEKAKVTIQILDEFSFIEFTVGKPTIEVELKRIK